MTNWYEYNTIFAFSLTIVFTAGKLEVMKVIVLTGGIGSGKSLVASILRELGAEIIDSDRIGREVLNPGTPGWQEVVDAFGKDIITPGGELDRKKLAQRVFTHPEDLRKLNRIVHPKVDAEVVNRLRYCRKQGARAVFVEMAILAEASWMAQVDQFWIVRAPQDLILKRLQGRGVSEADALARMANQPPPEEKIQRGPVFIDNSGAPEDLKITVQRLWYEILTNH